MATYEYNMLRDVPVEVTKVIDEKKRVIASVLIDGKYQHRFPHTSRVSKHLELMEPKDLAERLSGGSYFLVDGQLVDFRDHQYSGFVHTDTSIEVMMDLIGVQFKTDLKAPHQRKPDPEQRNILLRKVWTKNNIVVPGYGSGTEFDSILSFTWNPFVKTVNSAFDLIRLICTNGMVGITSILNTKVPVVNRWEEHLDIAAKQIQNKVDKVVTNRITAMIDSRASVADLMLLNSHAFERLYSATDKTPQERDSLIAILNATDARQRLGNIYRDAVFLDKNLGAQLPSYLTQFDAYNIATELRSHTSAVPSSSDRALDLISNNLLFDRNGDEFASVGRYSAPLSASFADADRAFYGRL